MENKNLQAVSQTQLTPEQIELVKNTVAKGATDDELKLFLYTASRTGLDPLTKQVYFVKRPAKQKDGTYKDQMTIQTGIDGYRAIAERSGTLAGIDDAVYDKEDAPHPNKASVTVYRLIEGQRVSYTASARWSEYAPQGSQAFMWNKMPYLMLAKCAEALALRKAFPNDLSGLYTSEEMQQADHKEELPVKTSKQALDGEVVTEPVKTPVKSVKEEIKAPVAEPVTENSMKRTIADLCKSLDGTIELSADTKKAYEDCVKQHCNIELKPENYELIIKILTREVKKNEDDLFNKIDGK